MPRLVLRFRYVEGIPEGTAFEQTVDISEDLMVELVRKEKIFQDAELNGIVYVPVGNAVWEEGVPVIELIPRSRVN